MSIVSRLKHSRSTLAPLPGRSIIGPLVLWWDGCQLDEMTDTIEDVTRNSVSKRWRLLCYS